MKPFLIRFLLFFGVPVLLLLGLYIIADPFDTIRPFSVFRMNVVNREYLSTELYLRNKDKYHYDSFIFSGSRGCALNSYQWKQYLPEGSSPFFFQGWGESVTGEYQKVKYLDNTGARIKNAIVLVDIPGTFGPIQEGKTALSLKHYLLTGKSQLYYHSVLFYSWLKPSEIYESARRLIHPPIYPMSVDTVTNDWNPKNSSRWMKQPEQNKAVNKEKFLFERSAKETFSEKLITPEFESMLRGMKAIFDKQKTDYKIIVTPDYYQVHINMEDLKLLQNVFGDKNVYNYSGKTALTEDMYNFLNTTHFDDSIGWQIIDDIYNKGEKKDSVMFSQRAMHSN